MLKSDVTLKLLKILLCPKMRLVFFQIGSPWLGSNLFSTRLLLFLTISCPRLQVTLFNLRLNFFFLTR